MRQVVDTLKVPALPKPPRIARKYTLSFAAVEPLAPCTEMVEDEKFATGTGEVTPFWVNETCVNVRPFGSAMVRPVDPAEALMENDVEPEMSGDAKERTLALVVGAEVAVFAA